MLGCSHTGRHCWLMVCRVLASRPGAAAVEERADEKPSARHRPLGREGSSDAYLQGGRPEAKRKLLVGSAHYILGPFGSDSDLRRHGQKIASRGGKNAKKRALVAVPRKLFMLLHSLWVSGELYKPLRNAHRLGGQAAAALGRAEAATSALTECAFAWKDPEMCE